MEIIGSSQIYEELPEITEEVDCMYCNPPADISSLTEAMPGRYETYEQYIHDLFKYIRKVNPKNLYIEVGITNRTLIKNLVEFDYECVNVDQSKTGYQKNRRRWIIRCGRDREAPAPVFPDVGTYTYIRALCNADSIRNIVHLYMTDAWLEIQAYKKERKVIAVTKPGQYEQATAKLRELVIKEDSKIHLKGGVRV